MGLSPLHSSNNKSHLKLFSKPTLNLTGIHIFCALEQGFLCDIGTLFYAAKYLGDHLFYQVLYHIRSFLKLKEQM